ncbi:hypothetical protein LJR164_002898 [Phenylobacterium sp. LjRoot164]|uniref:hypothetical protein n=1 Tax=unclassified Phenylobacterium TaxID=2640670 RepID=UPI003ECC2655
MKLDRRLALVLATAIAAGSWLFSLLAPDPLARAVAAYLLTPVAGLAALVLGAGELARAVPTRRRPALLRLAKALVYAGVACLAATAWAIAGMVRSVQSGVLDGVAVYTFAASLIGGGLLLSLALAAWLVAGRPRADAP